MRNSKSRAESNPRFAASIRNVRLELEKEVKEREGRVENERYKKREVVRNVILRRDWDDTARFASIIKH